MSAHANCHLARDACCTLTRPNLKRPVHIAETGKNSPAEERRPGEADVHELNAAMHWLLERQSPIENKLAKKHLTDGTLMIPFSPSTIPTFCSVTRFSSRSNPGRGCRPLPLMSRFSSMTMI